MRQRSCLRTLPVAVALTLLTASWAAEAQVTILKVGPHGDFVKIQDAIDAAVVGAQTEIRVEGTTTYVENLLIPASFNDGELALLGGWNMDFTDRPFAPPDTIIDGNQADRALYVRMGGGSLVVDRFTLTNGLADMGAGVSVVLSGDALVTLEDVRITGNTVTATGSAMGGGMRAAFGGSARVEVLNSRIHNNAAVNTAGGNARAGGLDILLSDSASFLVQGCEIDNNTIESASGFLWGAGISVILVQNTSGDLLDTTIADNTAIGTNGYASGGVISLQNFGTLNVERTAFGLNTVTGGGTASQLRTVLSEDASLRMSDSIVVLGDYDGINLAAYDSSTANLMNLTVADQLEDGIDLYQLDSSTVTLYNTISFGNLVDLRTSGGVDTGSNLIGVDPLFMNPAAIDYHLRIGSPAENAGDNSPPGGLGLLDFDGNPRIKDVTVDIGCYEGIAEILTDGFESGDTSAWSITVP